MPTYQQITAAREKAKRIREYAVAFRHESSLQRVAEIQPESSAKKYSQPSMLAQSATRERRAA